MELVEVALGQLLRVLPALLHEPGQVHVAHLLVLDLHLDEHRGVQLVGDLLAGVVHLHLDHVERVPAALELVVVHLLLGEEPAGEALLVLAHEEVAHAALVVQLGVLLEQLVALHLELSELGDGQIGVLGGAGREVGVGVGRPVLVAVAVELSFEEVLVHCGVELDSVWQIDFIQQVVLKAWRQVDETDLVLPHLGGRHHRDEVDGGLELFLFVHCMVSVFN